MVTFKKWNLKICLFFTLTVKCMVVVLMNVLGCILKFIKIKLCLNNINVIMVLLLRMIIFLMLRLKEIMQSWVMLLYLCLVTQPLHTSPIHIDLEPTIMANPLSVHVNAISSLACCPIVYDNSENQGLTNSLSLNIANSELPVMDCLLNTNKSYNIDVDLCNLNDQGDLVRNERNNKDNNLGTNEKALVEK
ncbi:hypothetical protein MA16_Dca024089 [Dendrobium catenatum]|uniref:Uncharacterized protein n=1 Tax=Dendrobium catenatum TaxID=906689 RepID=A0A2I0WBP4_9ASPA|nr:hypothetical protein MA16_Dca024089 [Dendrobium catenatum]